MKFIDDIIKGYEYSKAVSTFVDKGRLQGVNFRRLAQYPQLLQEYEKGKENAAQLPLLAVLGHMAYAASHPRRYLGKDNDYKVTENIFRNKKEEEAEMHRRVIAAINARLSSSDDGFPFFG